MGKSFHLLSLMDEHRALVSLCDDLKNRVETGEWRLCDSVWDVFARRLTEHMRVEEEQIFPRHERIGESEAKLVADLRSEHDRFRSDLDRIGLRIQLHELDRPAIDNLVKRLEAHAARENASLYPWAENLALTATPLSDSPESA